MIINNIYITVSKNGVVRLRHFILMDIFGNGHFARDILTGNLQYYNCNYFH